MRGGKVDPAARHLSAPLHSTGGDDVRRAATRAIASIGDEVVPLIKQKMAKNKLALPNAPT